MMIKTKPRRRRRPVTVKRPRMEWDEDGNLEVVVEDTGATELEFNRQAADEALS